MTTFTTVKARDQFADVVNRAAYGKERVVLTRRGKGLAAVVPIEDMEILEKLEDLTDLEDTRHALRESSRKGTVSWEKIKRDLGL